MRLHGAAPHHILFEGGQRMNKTIYDRLDETVWRTTLPNGLRICVVPKKDFTRKAAYLVTDYGSIHTKFTLDAQPFTTPDGVAHYLEHKMFDLPDRDVTEEFAALGANPNAFTTYDTTAYYFTCTDHFEKCLKLLLEFVSTPYFTQESVEKERGIIAQEILMYADSPESRVFEDLAENLYAHHPIRVPIAGSVESIQAITPQTLMQCHRAFYAPANMMLCVVGDVDAEAVAAIAQEVLPRERQSVGLPDLGAEEEMQVLRPISRRKMDVSMPMFQLGFKCPAGLTGAEFAHWEMVAELASEALFGESSGLYLKLYEQGLIDSSFGGGVETVEGTAMITCGGDSDAPERVRDAIIAQARRLGETGIDETEFARMKKSFLGRRVKDLDSFESTCFRLCAYEFEGFDYFRFPESFEGLKSEEVREFLREHIRQDNCSLAIVEPLEQKEDI